MNALALSAHQLRYEQRVFWRTPATIFFTAGLPVALLAIFTSINRDQRPTGVDGATFAAYFLPGMITFAIASTCYGNVAVRMVYRREAGLLRRARTTPLPPASFIAGYIANATIVAALVVLTLTTLGITIFDVPAPANSALVVATTLLGALALSAIGMALSTFIPRVDAADPIILGTLLPAMFISGAFQPVASDSILGRVSTVLPFRHLLQLDLAAFGTTHDHQALTHLIVVATWGVVGAWIAIRRFTWQPHH